MSKLILNTKIIFGDKNILKRERSEENKIQVHFGLEWSFVKEF